MKTLTYFLFAFALIVATPAQSQTVDEILDTYFENIGGKDNFRALKGLKMTAKLNQQGMEIPLEIYQMSDGRQMTLIKFQGKEIKQGVFDAFTMPAFKMITILRKGRDCNL